MTISTTPHATTYDQLLDRVIADGIAEVREAYADPKEHHKRDGAIEGFEECRGKTPAELVERWRAAEKRATQIMRDNHRDAKTDARDYWHQRHKVLQIEFGLTARGAMKYAAIVGVREEALS